MWVLKHTFWKRLRFLTVLGFDSEYIRKISKLIMSGFPHMITYVKRQLRYNGQAHQCSIPNAQKHDICNLDAALCAFLQQHYIPQVTLADSYHFPGSNPGFAIYWWLVGSIHWVTDFFYSFISSYVSGHRIQTAAPSEDCCEDNSNCHMVNAT
jgi:hypothetical protein